MRRRSGRPAAIALVVMLVVLAAAGGFLVGRVTAEPAEAGSVGVPSASPTITHPSGLGSPLPGTLDERIAALGALDRIVDQPYRRDEFGPRWVDVDGNGCDTRNDVLARDLVEVSFRDDERLCKVLAGRLVDPYDGSGVDFVFGPVSSQDVQIDHVVALAWAWKHGADAWSADLRLAFANDQDNLLAASAATNHAKRDSGPAAWLPPDTAAHCDFADRFTTVLERYDLAIGDGDRAALRTIAVDCG